MHHLHFDSSSFSRTGRLLDGNRHFWTLSIAPPNCTATITDYDQPGKAESPTTLDNASAAPNLQRMLDAFRSPFSSIITSILASVLSHSFPPKFSELKLQARISNTVRKRRNTPVVTILSTVKYDFRNPLLDTAFPETLANDRRRCNVPAILNLFAEILVGATR